MKHVLVIAALAAASVVPASAQDRPDAAQDKPPAVPNAAKLPAPLKVQFLLSRFQGEKKISSLPYTLGVLANGRQTSMRMGVSVPVMTRVTTSADKNSSGSAPTASYQYRDVGTNIDCTATDAGSGAYSLTVTVEDSSIQSDAADRAARTAPDAPVFRSFRASFSMLLRDGQSMQYVSVTDPLSGEVMRIDVSLSLAK